MVVTTKGVLKNIAKLLSVTEQDLEKALCFRVVAAGGDVVDKGHTEKEAVFAKDAFAKVCNSHSNLSNDKSYKILKLDNFDIALIQALDVMATPLLQQLLLGHVHRHKSSAHCPLTYMTEDLSAQPSVS